MSEADSSYASIAWGWAMFCTRAIGTLLIGVTLLIYFNQDRILYIPNPPGVPKTPDENPFGYSSPGEWNLKGNLRSEGEKGIPFIEHFVETKDKVRIHTWLLIHDDKPDDPPRPTLIYFHGNAANMGFRLPNAVQMFAHAQLNVLMVDYRGYGKSDGTPTEQGLQYDAEAVLEYALQHPRLRGSPILVFGRSLGGAVAMYLAHKFPGSVAGVIIENTFLSISAMTDLLMPIVKPVKPLLLRMFWDNERRVQDLHQPILFISGALDELVPHVHMTTLHSLAARSKHRELYTVANGRHNDTWQVAGRTYYKKLHAFVSQHILEAALPAPDCVDPPPPPPPRAEADAQAGAQAGAERSADGDEADYFVVNSASAIPTMGTDFVVR